MFKVIIVGGEDTNDYKFFAKKCIFYLKNKAKEGITILSTGDSYVNAFAKACNIEDKFMISEIDKFLELYSKSDPLIARELTHETLLTHDGRKVSPIALARKIRHDRVERTHKYAKISQLYKNIYATACILEIFYTFALAFGRKQLIIKKIRLCIGHLNLHRNWKMHHGQQPKRS
jgi:hypothetical protein